MKIELTLFQRIAAWLLLSCFCATTFTDAAFVFWFNFLPSDAPFKWFVGAATVLCFAIIGAAIFGRPAR